jgi:hypothetical protein
MEVRSLGGARGCVTMVLVSLALSVLVTVILNVALR